MNKYFNFKMYSLMHTVRVKNAFTLAEVLLSLLIISVIASLVIPPLIQDTENAGTAVKVRKYQNILSQAIMSIQADYKGDMLKSPLNTSSTDHANGWNTLKTKLNLIKDCGAVQGGNCWGSSYKFLNGNYWTNFNTYKDSGKGILADGSSINYETSGYCAANKSANNTGPLYNTECAVIFIDTNGPKSPNQGGRDVFTWHVLQDGSVLPYGSTYDKFGGCDPNSLDTTGGSDGSPGRGGGCTMQVLSDGKITY